LKHNRGILKNLFVTFCRLIDEEKSTEKLLETFFCQSFIFYGGANVNESRRENGNATSDEEMISSKIWGKNSRKNFGSQKITLFHRRTYSRIKFIAASYYFSPDFDQISSFAQLNVLYFCRRIFFRIV
jgi:hypothetical protein